MRKVQDTISGNAANAGIVLDGVKAKPHEVAWLAMKLTPWGEFLQAGETVLAGSFTRPALAKQGDVFNADYGRLGKFDFTFV